MLFLHFQLSDLSKSRNKLFYLRTHLLALSDTSDSPELSPKQEDSGYISPEDMATECHLIDTLRYRINNIKTENDCLKEQVRKLNNEVMSKTSSSTCRCKGYENSDKILQEVASALSNIVSISTRNYLNSNLNYQSEYEDKIFSLIEILRSRILK